MKKQKEKYVKSGRKEAEEGMKKKERGVRRILGEGCTRRRRVAYRGWWH